MGIAIPQVITPSKASGAQIIDGSLKFDKGKTQHLKKTFGSEGNRNVWTWSSWVKRGTVDAQLAIFSAHTATNNAGYGLIYLNQNSSDATFNFNNWDGGSSAAETSAVLRDTNGWYHLVVRHDENASPKAKLYINGQLQSLASNLSTSTGISDNIEHRIGHEVYNNRKPFDGAMSQCYFIDGQSLAPESFGFTDPLTNTWKPKKVSVTGPNDGRIWTNTATISSGSNAANKPLSNGFDGSTATAFEGDTSGATVTVPVSATISAGGVRVFAAVTSSNPLVVLLKNGGSTVETINTGSSGGQYYASSSYSGAITSLVISRTGRAPEFNAIEINGTMLIDGDRTNFGSNGFYLPMDGNSPIGEDKSGRGNDFTPVNFGGSMELDNPNVTGARPILNTTQGGTAAGVGVFGSKQNVGYAVTVYNDGGGNKYYIDGVKQATLTGLIRGATYTFDTSDSTVSSHPFRFSATSNGSHGGGSQYTSGVAAITGAATTITVPHDAPNTLYYYCTSHSGMGADITGITTNEKLADQYAANCVIALPLIGSNTDVSASINCTSTTKAMTSNGNAAASSDTSHFYNGSFEFDGSGDYLSTSDNSDFAFGTGDFTVEVWYNPDDIADYRTIIDSRDGGVNSDNGWILGQRANGKIYVYSNSVFLLESTSLPKVGAWTHLAFVRSGSTSTLYINGIAEATSTTSKNYTDDRWRIGAESYDGQSGSFQFNGYISDARAYKGVAKYTSNFVPAATSPDILPDTPSGVSGSSKLTKISDGAVAFDGTNDSVSIADHADFTFGSGDFTMEAFVYNRSSGYRSIVMKYGGAPSTSSWFWSMYNGQNQFYYYSGGNEPAVTSGQTHYNKWVHCAVSREGNTIRLFDNGELTGTLDVSSYDTMNDSTVPLDIGADYADNYDMDGFISNVRIVKGTALYTSRFTPPSAPLTNVTNTKLLCCQSPTSATEAAVSPSTPSVVNDAAATNFNPFNTDINTVRGQETGYATLNPLNNNGGTLSSGNLSLTSSGAANVSATLQIPTTGKWYWEYFLYGLTSGGVLGISDGSAMNGTALTDWTKIYGYSPNGNKYENASASSYGATLATGDLVGVKYDADTRQLEFLKNNISQGVAYTVSSDYDYYPSIHGNILEVIANFGQKPFKFPPPEGYQPLNAANVRPVKVISRPDQYVGVTTYAGNGTSVVVSDYQFKPDLVWIKGYTDADRHGWYDSVRGVQKRLQTAHDNTEDTQNGVMSFDDRGFSVGNYSDSNGSGRGYVAWAWKAGGNKNTFNIDDVGYASASAAGMAAGDLNSTAYNTSQRWSNNLSVNTGSVSNTTQAFNGNLTNGADSTGSSGSNDRVMTVTLGLALNNETVEVYPNHTYSGYYATIDGVQQTIQYQVTDYGFAVMGPFTGTLTSVSVTNGTESSQRPAGIRAIKVAGKILIDDNITPPNIPNIAPTGASVGTKQGFAIVKYTGNSSNQSTVPHKLLEAPKFVIIKNLTRASQNWIIGHVNAGEPTDNSGFTGFRQGNQLYFTSGALDGGTSQFFSGAHPEVNYFTVKDNYEVNYLNDDYIAYLWHDVPGLQKFGRYKGLGGTANGSFVELGFRPAVVWVKDTANSNSNSHWCVFDNLRPGFNKSPAQNRLHIDADNAQDPDRVDEGNGIDILSNGFRVRSNNWYETNVSSGTYIYCAWAEAPTVDLFGGGANAR